MADLPQASFDPIRAQMLRQDFLAALDVMKENAQKGTTEGSGGKFSLQYLEHFSQKEYNNWGWAIVNDLLTEKEYTHLMDQFARSENLDDKYRMTPNGEKLILVGNSAGNYDHLVFIKGTYDHPIITRVVGVWSDFDRLFRGKYLEEARIYAAKEGVEGITVIEGFEGERIFTRKTIDDCPTYRELRRTYDFERNQRSNPDRGAKQNAGRSAGEDSETAGDRENHERVKHSLGIEATTQKSCRRNTSTALFVCDKTVLPAFRNQTVTPGGAV